MVGELVNATDALQQIVAISGTFYTDQNAVLAESANALDFFPEAVVPAGGRVPFEIQVHTAASITQYDLEVNYLPSLKPLRSDLQSTISGQRQDSGRYCLSGLLVNPTPPLTENLVIAVVLYDAAGAVVNFADYTVSRPVIAANAPGLNFDICVPPPNTGVAQAVTLAWGR